MLRALALGGAFLLTGGGGGGAEAFADAAKADDAGAALPAPSGAGTGSPNHVCGLFDRSLSSKKV